MSDQGERVSEPLTKADLDAVMHRGCQECGRSHPEEPLCLIAACHDQAGVNVEYCLGVLTVTCRACERYVTHIRVAGP